MFTWDDVYYPGQIFRPRNNACVKPSLDNAASLKDKNCHLLGLHPGTNPSVNLAHFFSMISARLGLLTMPSDKVAVLQYPGQSRLPLLFNSARRHGNKVIFLVHDIDELRFGKDEPELLGEADILIVHTPRMKEWAEKKYPNVKCIVLGVFDYRIDFSPTKADKAKNELKRQVVYAGNLFKSGFIGELNNIPNSMEYLIYGSNPPEKLAEGVIYKGVVSPDILPYEISSADFGLVWDGPSVDGCKGQFGDYLRYNIPYKASCYLSAGLPLIVWEDMGFADFVKKEGIGICIGNLNELPSVLAKLDKNDYIEMKRKAMDIQKKISSGYFFIQAMQKALDILNR